MSNNYYTKVSNNHATGSDFSNICVRGINFTQYKSDLLNANFHGATAGLPIFWHICLTISFFLLSSLISVSLSAGIEPVIFAMDSQIISNIILFLILAIFFIAIILKGFQGGLIVGAIASTIGLLISTPLIITRVDNLIVPFVFNGIFLLVISLTGIIIFSFSITATLVLTKWQVTVLIIIIDISLLIFSIRSSSDNIFVFFKTIALLGTIVIVGFYVALCSLSNDKRFELVRSLGIRCCVWHSTSFRNVNLTDADFSKATVKCIDLRGATLIRTYWLNARGLDYACVTDGYLQYPQIRKLVTTLKGQKQKFDHLNLEGINLKGANLQYASFIGTNLNNANLQDADLSRATLVQSQLDGTDFTGATLTGAYIEDWGITNKTKLNGVRCEYVFMQLPTIENPEPLRKPDNNKEAFADGEFGDFIQPLFDTLDLYHSQGVDPRAIAISFKQLAENHPEADLRIVGMEVRGENKFLLRTKTAATADKSELSAEYFDTYNETKGLPERETGLLLAEKDSRIRSLETMVVTALERPSFYSKVEQVGFMTNNPGGFSVGGSVGGNVNNVQGDNNRAVQGDNNQAVLGDNNQVTQKNQVGANTGESLTKEDIIKLLAELETLIQGAELPANTKEEIIEDLSAVKKATDKEEPNKQRALERLTTVAETLDKTSKGVEAGQKIWTTAKPIIVKVAKWLGAAGGSHLLHLLGL